MRHTPTIIQQLALASLNLTVAHWSRPTMKTIITIGGLLASYFIGYAALHIYMTVDRWIIMLNGVTL